MKTIYKYRLLDISWTGVLQIPKRALFCGFDFQHKNPTLWFEVNTGEPTEARSFEVVGTGHEVPDDAQHLASIQINDNGRYWVWHLYERNM